MQGFPLDDRHVSPSLEDRVRRVDIAESSASFGVRMKW